MAETWKVFYKDANEQWQFGPYPGTSGTAIARKDDESLEAVAARHSLPLDLVKQAFGAEAAKQLRAAADELTAEADVDEAAAAAEEKTPAKHRKHKGKK